MCRSGPVRKPLWCAVVLPPFAGLDAALALLPLAERAAAAKPFAKLEQRRQLLLDLETAADDAVRYLSGRKMGQKLLYTLKPGIDESAPEDAPYEAAKEVLVRIMRAQIGALDPSWASKSSAASKGKAANKA